jgi:hypothetical protein
MPKFETLRQPLLWFWITAVPRKEKKRKFPLTPMGVLAPVSAQRDTPLSPPSTSAEIFRRTCLQSHLQTSPPTPQKSYPKFRNPRTNFQFFFLNLKTAPTGARGCLRFFLGLISPFFVRKNPLWSFRSLTDLLLKFSKKHLKKPKIAPRGPGGGGPNFFSFFQIFFFFF